MSSKYTNHSQDKYIIGGVAIALILVGLIVVWLSTSNSPIPPVNPNTASTTSVSSTTTVTSSTTVAVPGDSKTVVLAKCLAQNKVTMYGAAWCPHCKEQKEAFGSAAWQYVPYVECPENTQVCISKQIKGYPTWLKTDGTKLEGFTPLDKLATWASCQY